MPFLRHTLRRLSDFFNLKVSTQNTISFSLQYYCKRTLTWYNQEDYDNAKLSIKIIHYMLKFLVAIVWTLIVLDISWKSLSLVQITKMCDAISLVLGGSITVIRFYEHSKDRKLLSNLIKEINQRVCLAKVTATRNVLSQNVKLYVLLATTICVEMCLQLCLNVTIFLYSVSTGECYLKIFLPVERSSYSIIWWIEVLSLEVVVIYSNIFYTFMDALLIDCAIQLTFLYRVEYDNWRDLCSSEELLSLNVQSMANNVEDLQKYLTQQQY